MSLRLLRSTIPFQYELCQPGDGALYNPYLCTPPRIYREELQPTGGIFGFYYDAQKDRFILIANMKYSLWPSWRHNVYEIDPSTGLAVKETLGITIANIFFTDHYENGELKQVYANRFAGSDQNTIMSVDPVTYASNSNDIVVASADVGGFNINEFVLNRADGMVALSDTSRIRIYHYPTQTLVDNIAFPELTIADFGYETKELAWALLKTETDRLSAMKFNYLNPNVEALTALPDPGEAVVEGGVAYDSKRKNLAVYTQLANATDGAHRGTMEIFKPFTDATNLTSPVPLERIQPFQVVTMEAHLVDDLAVGGAAKPVKVTNSGDGTILQPTVTPRANGTVAFQYQAGANPGTDVITLEADL